jgi:hypothetical protein
VLTPTNDYSPEIAMPRYTTDNMLDVLEIQQVILDWAHDLDINGGFKVAELCTADCSYAVGGRYQKGRAEILKFYTDRAERIRTQQKDGVRTQRHSLTNIRVALKDQHHATVRFLVVNYSAEGKPPAMDLKGPTIVADSHMECRRDTDGEWRIELFDSEPVFVGNDPFLNASVVKK